jgi:muramidase (phage lysozyme)
MNYYEIEKNQAKVKKKAIYLTVVIHLAIFSLLVIGNAKPVTKKIGQIWTSLTGQDVQNESPTSIPGA